MSLREAFAAPQGAGFGDQLAELSLASAARVREARTALADLGADRSHLVTEGQAYVLHLIAALVDEFPEAPDVDVLAWVVGRGDAEQLAIARERGLIRRLRYVTDPLFWTIKWHAWPYVRRGADQRARHANHAKAYLVHRGTAGAVILSSGNCNANRRIEHHLVDRSPQALAFWCGLFDQLVTGGDPFEAGDARKVVNT